ncbi:hypothetical protein OPV22_003864 [Ensete ventricosum]|uniref:Uncharacterized protein n=1 Tax=Ensete ventricosum TaxID=4639 RepID=A0AAV8S262_ENSVE|nr:hypothetical protein OPV22_003864 [Ensete ventricosum]
MMCCADACASKTVHLEVTSSTEDSAEKDLKALAKHVMKRILEVSMGSSHVRYQSRGEGSTITDLVWDPPCARRRAPNPTHALNKSDFLDHIFSAEYHIVGSSAISLVLFRLIRHPSSDLTARISSRLGNAFTYNNPPPKVKCPSRLRKGESDEFSGPRSVP